MAKRLIYRLIVEPLDYLLRTTLYGYVAYMNHSENVQDMLNLSLMLVETPGGGGGGGGGHLGI